MTIRRLDSGLDPDPRIARSMQIRDGNCSICVLGNFSGRNAGDIAILGSLLRDIRRVVPGVTFIVPTLNPVFIKRTFPEFNVEPVSLMPWTLSLKMMGLSTLRAIFRSDLVLVTDNLLFDKQLFNPLFNYLLPLAILLPWASKRGIPVVLYNMSLGPVRTALGRQCLRRIVSSAESVILRDAQSKDLIEELGITSDSIARGADCALNTVPCSKERLGEIIEAEGLFRNPRGTIGINVNSYVNWFSPVRSRRLASEDFARSVAEAVEQVVDRTGVDVLFIVTQLMDLRMTRQVIRKIHRSQRIKIVSNRDYSFGELAGIMGRLDLLVGMRTHSLIFAASLGTPVVGIASYPKTVGFMTSIQQDNWMVSPEDVTNHHLAAVILQAYEERERIRANLLPAVSREKYLARRSADLLTPFFNESYLAEAGQ